MVVFFFGMRFLFPAYNGDNSFVGNGIVTGSAEGIASEQSPNGQDKSYEKSALTKRLHSVLGAGWSKSAAWRKKRGYKLFV